MSSLIEQKCEACKAEAPRVTKDESKELMLLIPDWSLKTVESVERLKRVFEFNNYSTALEFTNGIAGLAEEEDHHPAILLEWGKVQVSWWTHKIGGLHKNDFICAAKTDQLFNS